MRLIDADEYEKRIKPYDTEDVIDKALYNFAHEKLITTPTAQPEIIRCKDCKFWTHVKRTNRYWCKTDDGLYDLNPSPDDFCSRAERRTDEIN